MPNLRMPSTACIQGIFSATGQTCIAGSRLLVQKSILEPLLEKLAERTRRIKLGDPQNTDTEMGPVAFKEQLDKVKFYCQKGVEEGGKVNRRRAATSGERLDAWLLFRAHHFPRCHQFHDDRREEIFGPVLCGLAFKFEAEAIDIANDTRFWPGRGVWTQNIQTAHPWPGRCEPEPCGLTITALFLLLRLLEVIRQVAMGGRADLRLCRNIRRSRASGWNSPINWRSFHYFQ